MQTIETDVPEIIVEIEGGEYNVAPRTVEVMEKLADAEKKNTGKPAYKLWLDELEILLGKDGCKKLFVSGKKENVDRIQMIYAGVARAFMHTDDAVAAASRERDAEAVATAVAPINELLRNIRPPGVLPRLHNQNLHVSLSSFYSLGTVCSVSWTIL